MLQRNVDVVIVAGCAVIRTAGPYRIATELRDAGYTCQVIDNIQHFSVDELGAIITYVVGPNTKVVGFSSTFIDYNLFENRTITDKAPDVHDWYNNSTEVKYVIDAIKRIAPTVKVLIGGAYSHGMRLPLADVFVLGLGDRAIIEYLNYLQNKNPFFQFTTNNAGKMVIDSETFSNKFDFTSSQIKYHPSDYVRYNEVLPLEVSRGCIFKCSFCAYPLLGKDKNDYIKSTATLKDEILRNYYEYGITRYTLTDNTFNDNIIKLEELADIVQSLPFSFSWIAYLRIDLMRAHPEQYQLLRDSGLTACNFGIETLNFESAKSIGKGLHPEKTIEELFVVAEKLPAVAVHCGFICGLPYETKESISQWAEIISADEFPIDFITINPLSLNRAVNKSKRVFKSEFELNADKYYTWVNNSDGIWDNGNFDFKWAQEFCSSFHEQVTARQRIGGWNTALMPTVLTQKHQWNEVHNVAVDSYENNISSYKKSLLTDMVD